jgi:hypothetical protein
MASRNYSLAFDTPYNEKLLNILDKYNRKKDLNGEPDMFSDRLEGGAIPKLPNKHPHLFHQVLEQPVARNVIDGGAMNRPPGMVDPFIHRGAHGTPFSMVQSGTMAAYPVYNAVEMRSLQGGASCYCKAMPLEGGFDLGKSLKSVGKSISKGLKKASPVLKEVGKIALPIAEKVAMKAAETAVKSYMTGGEVVKKPRGRPRKEGGSIHSILKSVAKVGKSAGKPFEKAVGVNPFSLGYDLGHDVIAPALKKELKKGKGVKSAGAVDGRKKRAEIVKKVMAEKGMKMIEASKYVKANNLY